MGYVSEFDDDDAQNAQELKTRNFENLHLMTFGDLDLILTSHDAQNAFSMHRTQN